MNIIRYQKINKKQGRIIAQKYEEKIRYIKVPKISPFCLKGNTRRLAYMNKVHTYLYRRRRRKIEKLRNFRRNLYERKNSH